ncbi:MAG: hypoxanthine phosphoribosyltransferase [Eubacteriales bacterium]|nr:hypoxanthine phosphoribosyltransferase [Eubacteriales bacterium]
MQKDIKYVLMTEDEIKSAVERLSEKINNDFAGEPVLALIILKGSMFFASDLLKKLTMPVTIDFMKATSYGHDSKSSGNINILLDTSLDLAGLNVLIIEDIIDSGNTLSKLKSLLAKRNPKCIKLCTLLDKPERRESEINADYTGKIIPNEFVVGYGLDFAERYRNLPYIGVLDEKVYS